MATTKKSTASKAAKTTTPENNVIDSKSATRGTGKKTKTVAAVAQIADGVIGASTLTVEVKETAPVNIESKPIETLAVYSTKNVHWQEVGSIKRGYNILPKSIAEQWLSARPSHTRLATPEEVAKEFGA